LEALEGTLTFFFFPSRKGRGGSGSVAAAEAPAATAPAQPATPAAPADQLLQDTQKKKDVGNTLKGLLGN
jgi:hypothetical protein